MRLRLPTVLALALAAAPVFAQESAAPAPGSSIPAISDAAPVSLTLREALQRALSANPALGRSRADVAAAQAQEDVTFSAILPRVAIQSNYTRNDQEVAFGSGEDARTILPADDYSYRLTFSQPIYAGNRERKAIQQSRLAVESARQGLLGAEDQIVVSVVSNYLGVVEAEELLAVEQRNLELARKRREQAQIFFEAGETTRVDVLRAESAIKAAERRLAAARQAREAAVGRLRLDLALDGPIRVQDPGDLFPQLPAEPALMAEAERGRPEVAQVQAAFTSAQLEVAKQKGAYLPLVTADGAWINQRSAFPSDQYGQVSIRMTIPVYTSGELKGRIAVARERERQAALRVEEVRRAVREEVHQALVDLQTAEASLQLAREQLAASEAEYEQATELYRAQELTSLEAEAAETSLAEARRVVAASKLDRDLAELRVWAAAGLLDKTIPLEGGR